MKGYIIPCGNSRHGYESFSLLTSSAFARIFCISVAVAFTWSLAQWDAVASNVDDKFAVAAFGEVTDLPLEAVYLMRADGAPGSVTGWPMLKKLSVWRRGQKNISKWGLYTTTATISVSTRPVKNITGLF